MRYLPASMCIAVLLGAFPTLALGQTTPTAQRSVATPATPSARLPTLELVAQYGCEAPCSPPTTFGTAAPIRAVAAGRGNTFAVLTRDDPYVHVWNLDTGKLTVFGDSGRAPGQIFLPVGLMVAGDTIVVAQGPILNRKLMRFMMDGRFIDSLPVIEGVGPPDSKASDFHGSPTGRWAGVGGTAFGGESLVRIKRETGANETLDVPASLIAGSLTTPASALSWASVAVSDDGTVAMGYGETAYRLLVFPGDGSPRIEGGRSIPPMPLPPAELERIRNTPIRAPTIPADASPELRAALERIAAVRPDASGQINPNRRFFSYRAIRFDAQGRLWVNTERGRDETPSHSVFDVFSSKLEYLGEVSVDTYVGTGYHIGPQLMVAMTYPASGGATVTVWRIREP